MNIIKLQTHDNSNNYLEKITKNKYKLVSELPYFRIGYANNNHEDCFSIDPPGGPMICVGDIIEGLKVKAIYDNGIIDFEDDLSCNNSE